MKEQHQEMIDEIETLQKLIMQSSRDMHSSSSPKKEEQPSMQELKEYSNKLQTELLKSEHSVKVLKAMNTATIASSVKAGTKKLPLQLTRKSSQAGKLTLAKTANDPPAQMPHKVPLKLKIKPMQKETKEAKPAEVKKKPMGELYGLDIALLQELGLDDIIPKDKL